MEGKIQKQIVDYFSYFEEFYNTTRTSLKDCQNCAVAINKLIKRCSNIKQWVFISCFKCLLFYDHKNIFLRFRADIIGSPLEEFTDIKTKLCTIILNLISEEVLDIKSKL